MTVPPLRVLLVEDEFMIAVFIASLLTANGMVDWSLNLELRMVNWEFRNLFYLTLNLATLTWRFSATCKRDSNDSATPSDRSDV